MCSRTMPPLGPQRPFLASRPLPISMPDRGPLARGTGGELRRLIRATLVWLGAEIRACYERWQQRRVLETLDDRLLRDIGVTRADACRELRKPFWRP